jgi:hypothetical protein
MTPDEYIAQRVDDQINYYDTQSKKSQSHYKLLARIQIISGALIPIVSGFSDSIIYSDWIVAILGLAVTIATAFLALNKHQEHWINYRTTCETLKHMKHLFITGSSPYNESDSFNKFVNDIELMISKENSNWGSYSKKQNTGAE